MTIEKPKAGGQAVIEGVMMLVPGGYALSVRQPDKTIKTEKRPFKKITERNKFLHLPFIRGVASFIESMVLGYESINKSAAIAYGETLKGGAKETLLNALTIILSLAIGFGIFFFGPVYVGTILKLQGNQLLFNLFAGGFRFLLFIIYIVAISYVKDIKRLFMYHGAEHKTIYAYESGDELTVENIRKYSTKHPRCGTSFIFITLLTAILFYAVIDYFVFMTLNIPNNPFNRFLNHMIFLPLIASVSYELLMLAGKFYRNPLVKFMVWPGILFQYITTKEPTDDMIEVAAESLKSSFEASSGVQEK
ncbi:MAG: DUF1385 domain-containing protein [bacterium]|nr:DUF1385 domain-containing protein [bacterium]